MKTMTTLLMFSAAVFVAACGGSDAPPAASDGVPDEASVSVQGMTGWLTRLSRDDTAEAKEPVDAAPFAPPTSDDSEPADLT
jgi:hypothetical protein